MLRTLRRESDRLRSEIADGADEYYDAKTSRARNRRCGRMIMAHPRWGLAMTITVPDTPWTLRLPAHPAAPLARPN